MKIIYIYYWCFMPSIDMKWADEEDGVEAVSGYCCSCPNGLRTVGCCAHVATVLWFLGFGRHQSEIPISAAFLNDVCVELGGQEQQ